MTALKDFISLYRLYRQPNPITKKQHPPVYALHRAYQIAFKGYPF